MSATTSSYNATVSATPEPEVDACATVHLFEMLIPAIVDTTPFGKVADPKSCAFLTASSSNNSLYIIVGVNVPDIKIEE